MEEIYLLKIPNSSGFIRQRTTITVRDKIRVEVREKVSLPLWGIRMIARSTIKNSELNDEIS